MNPGVMEHILIGADCSPQELELYTTLLNNYATCFFGHTKKFLVLTLRLSSMKSKHMIEISMFEKYLTSKPEERCFHQGGG
jgi:hypothetical protein